MFQISDKVVCISDLSSLDELFTPWAPRRMAVYVVRDCFYDLASNGDRMWGVYLVGITGERMPDGFEMGLAAHYFRKLEEVQEFNRNLNKLADLLTK